VHLPGLNCVGPWNGGNNLLDGALVSFDDGLGALKGCKEACLANRICEGITVTTVLVDWEKPHYLNCGLRNFVQPDKCIADGHHDLFYLVSPLRTPHFPTGIPLPAGFRLGLPVAANTRHEPHVPMVARTAGDNPPAAAAGADGGEIFYGGGRQRSMRGASGGETKAIGR
jgi:hypothetical protein